MLPCYELPCGLTFIYLEHTANSTSLWVSRPTSQRLTASKLRSDARKRVAGSQQQRWQQRKSCFSVRSTDDIDHEQQPTFLYLLDSSCQLFEGSEEVLAENIANKPRGGLEFGIYSFVCSLRQKRQISLQVQ